MKLNVTALALTAGLLWAVAILMVQAMNAILPPYGGPFLMLLASIYPGYRPDEGIGYVLVGMFYGLVDGLISGAIFAWVYNAFAELFAAKA